MAPITFIYPSSMAPGAPASRHGLQQTAPMLPKELTGCSSRHLHRAARTAHPQPLQAGSSLQQYRNALGKARIAQAGQGPVQPREGQEDPALLQGCDIPTCPCWARCSVPAALHRSCSTAWSCPLLHLQGLHIHQNSLGFPFLRSQLPRGRWQESNLPMLQE